MMIYSIAQIFAALILAPMLIGTINRVKSVVSGRNGPSLIQPYHDLFKLLRKGTVYSSTTTWALRSAPALVLASTLCALMFLPLGGNAGVFGFAGDIVLFAGLLAIGRFATILAALDTGSAFEGMGASREAQFSILTEPALLIGLAAPALMAGSLSLSGLIGRFELSGANGQAAPALILSAMALFIVLLVENSRIPADDPNTHLELTMIHEVMILDYSGPDLGLMEYAAALKLWMLGALVSGVLIPAQFDDPAVNMIVGVVGVFATAILVGIVESSMARLKLLRMPQFIIAASILAITAALLAGV